MDTKALRQKILDLAIRGKLVPQDPNDEPASVLLERIRAEKERLISEGKIKRPKKSKASSSESHYRNLPKGWSECKIEDVAKTLTDFVASGSFASLRENVQYYDSPNYAILVRTKDLGSNFKGGLVYTDKHGYDFLSNSNLYGGELILPNIGASIGKVFLMPKIEVPTTLAPNSIMIRCWEEPTLKWLYLLFQSTLGQEILASISASTAQAKFNKTDLREVIIPLPPLYEQERILVHADSLLEYVETINTDKSDLIKILNSVKSKILELAMQGKLVPQDPADEPAADMLRRVNPKARIITDNPHSWNIPTGWCLSTVKDLCIFLSRGKSPKYADSPNQYPVFAQKCNLKDGGVSLEQARFLDESTLDKWPEKYRLRSGDVLINSTGTGTVGRTRLFSESILGNYPFTLPDSHVSVVRSYDEINSTYLFYYLFSSTIQKYFEDNLAGSTNQKELYIDVIGNTEVLLPPINEQQRIVAKIEELYAVLDEIEASLQS